MSSYLKEIQFNKIVTNVKALSHRQVLLSLAQGAAKFLQLSETEIYEYLCLADKKNNSAIGDRVALINIQSRRVEHPFTMLMTLQNGVTHNTPDGLDIKLYCLVVSPARAQPVHLRQISRLSRLLKNKTLHARIDETGDTEIIQSLLQDPEGWLLAA